MKKTETIIERNGEQFKRVSFTQYCAVLTVFDEDGVFTFDGTWSTRKDFSLRHAQGLATHFMCGPTYLNRCKQVVTYKERTASYEIPYKEPKTIRFAGHFTRAEHKPAFGAWDLH